MLGELNFAIKNTLRIFSALEPIGENRKEFDKMVEEKWSEEYYGVLIDESLTNFQIEPMLQTYSGQIVVELVQLKPCGHKVGIEHRTLLQHHRAEKYGSLPSGVFEISIRLSNVDEKTIQTINMLLDFTEKLDWESIQSYQFNFLKSEYEKYKKGEVVRSVIPKTELDKLDYIISHLIESYEDEITESSFWEILGSFSSVLGTLSEMGEDPQKSFRARVGESIFRYRKTQPTNKKFLDSLDTLIQDVFHIFSYFMNLMIRYLKYEHQQYWLREIEKQDIGYFFWNSEVTVNGRGPFVPSMSHTGNMHLLQKDFVIKRSRWPGIIKITRDYESLKVKSGVFKSMALDEIFSSSFKALEEERLEDAVLLGETGLETAMRRALEYFNINRRNLPGVVNAVKILLEKYQVSRIFPTDYKNLWRLIEGKPISAKKRNKYPDYKDGLIPYRHKSAHGRHRQLIDRKLGKRIGELVSAGRQISYILDLWIDTKPDRSLVTDEKIEK